MTNGTCCGDSVELVPWKLCQRLQWWWRVFSVEYCMGITWQRNAKTKSFPFSHRTRLTYQEVFMPRICMIFMSWSFSNLTYADDGTEQRVEFTWSTPPQPTPELQNAGSNPFMLFSQKAACNLTALPFIYLDSSLNKNATTFVISSAPLSSTTKSPRSASAAPPNPQWPAHSSVLSQLREQWC